MLPPQVLVVGSLNMDLVVRVPRAPEAGETLRAHAFMTNPGGKGANQATACARLGARVAMAGCVGRDPFGATLRAGLEQEGIDVRQVATVDDATGVALIMVDDTAENRIAIVAGANARVDELLVDGLRSRMRAQQIVLLQLEIPIAAVVRAARIARECGCTVVLNPAPVQPLPEALWLLVDVLVVNETEASVLGQCAVDGIAGAREAACALRAKGPRTVIVTLGSEGVVLADAGGCRHFRALRVRAIDTTAAGDTFIGAVCAALVNGAAMDAAVAFAIQAAAICVTRSGAQVSIPCRADVEGLPQVAAPTALP